MHSALVRSKHSTVHGCSVPAAIALSSICRPHSLASLSFNSAAVVAVAPLLLPLLCR